MKRCNLPRPEWPYKISFEDFKWLITHRVKQIVHHNHVEGCDEHYWGLRFHSENESLQDPPYWHMYFIFEPAYNGLLSLNYEGGFAKKRYEEIIAWDKKNHRDLKTYERLKKKFNQG